MNISNGSESKNHNTIDSRKKRDEISPYRSEMENIGLQDGVGIDVMFLYPHSINMPIWNKILSIINF